MPPLSDKELEERLTGVGNSILRPPSSVDELLPLLDKIEELLSKVEQSPAKSMQNALSPLMKALVVEELMKHSDVDVKVGVASCISEITRITAPDAPYDDDKMKDVFQLIVSSFENLSDTSSRSHEKRATILETVAKVRSCVIMLDLECDQMVIEMFQHFLKAIRGYHAEVIFASMETIMTLVLEESEEICPELLAPILASLKRNDEDVMPIAKKLAEKVIKNSADKLRPYLAQAVKSLDASLDDYSEVVASVCQGDIVIDGPVDESTLKDQVVEKKSTSASAAQDPVTQAVKDGREEGANSGNGDHAAIGSPKSIVSNGVNEPGTEETMTDTISSKKADSNYQLDAKSMSKTESDDLDAQKPVDSEAKPEYAEAKKEQRNHETPDKDVHTSPSEVKPVEAAKSLDEVPDTTNQLSPSEAPVLEAVNIASPTHSVSLPDENQSSKDGIAKIKDTVNVASPTHTGSLPDESRSSKDSMAKSKDVVNVASPARSGSLPDESQSSKDGLAKGKENSVKEELVSGDTATKKASEGEFNSEAKNQRRLGKKQTDETTYKDKALADEGASKNEDGGTSDSEARSLEQAEKLGAASNKAKGRSSLRKAARKKKSGRVKPTSAKDVPKSSAREVLEKDMVSSPRSPLKSTKVEGIQEETPKTSAKRKRTPGTEKASETKEYGTNLVGSKVKVWWPDDRTFYEGVVESFDSVKKKHKVFYNDGDIETLNLRKEKWEFIRDDSVSDGDQDVEHSGHEASSELHSKKKGAANSETSSKRRKMEGSPKSKQKDSTKSGAKSKDEGKAELESKYNNSKAAKKSVDDTSKSQKLGGKSQGDSAKTSGKSKDDVAKTSSHSKQDSQRTAKSKGKTPQSGKTGTKMAKSSLSKVKETVKVKEKTADSTKSSKTIKGKSGDAAKSRESETKSGKKRKR